MITIFNRREVAVTFDMKEQASICEVLAKQQIDYRVKVVNRMSPSPMAGGTRTHTGTVGQDLSAMNEYIIYVHKSDFEQAKHILTK